MKYTVVPSIEYRDVQRRWYLKCVLIRRVEAFGCGVFRWDLQVQVVLDKFRATYGRSL